MVERGANNYYCLYTEFKIFDFACVKYLNFWYHIDITALSANYKSVLDRTNLKKNIL